MLLFVIVQYMSKVEELTSSIYLLSLGGIVFILNRIHTKNYFIWFEDLTLNAMSRSGFVVY